MSEKRLFTEEEAKRLEEEYAIYRDAGKLDALADDMGRTKAFICRKAGELGLTDKKRKARWAAKLKYIPDEVLRELLEQCAKSSRTIEEFCNAKGVSPYQFRKVMKERFPAEWDAVIELKASKRSHYRVGRDFEYATKKDLEKMGYFVLRSPASKSPTDLVAVRNGFVVFVQCKVHGAITRKEWNGFLDFSESFGATPVLAQRGETGRGVDYTILTEKKEGKRRVGDSPKPT